MIINIIEMPYNIKKIGSCYQVSNKITGKIHAKCTTLDKAKNQITLMTRFDNKGNGLKNNISNNNIMSQSQLRNRILELLEKQADGPYTTDMGIRGGEKKINKKEKEEKKLTEWQKCVQLHGVKDAQLYYNPNTKKCLKHPKDKKEMDDEMETFMKYINKSNINKKVRKTREIKPKRKGEWQECLKRYGRVDGSLNYDRKTKSCDRSKPSRIDPVAFAEFAKNTVKGRKLISEYRNLMGGCLEMSQLENALDHLIKEGYTLEEAHEMVKYLKNNNGGDWFESFKKGFMMPFDAVSKLSPFVPLLL